MASVARGVPSQGPAETPPRSVTPASGKVGGTASQSDIDAMLAEMADEAVGKLTDTAADVSSDAATDSLADSMADSVADSATDPATDEPDLDAVLAEARDALSRETGGEHAVASAPVSGAAAVAMPGDGSGVGAELDALFDEINKSTAEINALAGEVTSAIEAAPSAPGASAAASHLETPQLDSEAAGAVIETEPVAGEGSGAVVEAPAAAAPGGDPGLDALFDEIKQAGAEIDKLAEEAARAAAPTPAAPVDATAGGSDLDALFDEINKAGAEIDKLVPEQPAETPEQIVETPEQPAETPEQIVETPGQTAELPEQAADAVELSTDVPAASAPVSDVDDGPSSPVAATAPIPGPLIVEGVAGAESAGVPEHKGPPFLCAADEWKPLSDELELAGGFDVLAALPEVKKDRLGWLTRPVMTLLVAVNRPVEGLSPRARSLVGGIGLVTLVNAAAVLGWLWWARLRG